MIKQIIKRIKFIEFSSSITNLYSIDDSMFKDHSAAQKNDQFTLYFSIYFSIVYYNKKL